MLAIKGMEMPNACTSTQEILGDIGVINCPLYNVCKYRDTIRTNYKPDNCPLVEIVTCGDCKYNAYQIATYEDSDKPTRICCKKNEHAIYPRIDGFCSDGKRRE